MRHATRRVISTLAAILLAGAIVSGCTPQEMTFVDEGRTYDSADLASLLRRTNAVDLTGKPTNRAPGLRHDAMVALRRLGDRAAESADLITLTFPGVMRSVPFYVERGSYNGRNAVVMIEVVGREDGELENKRLWVLGEDGAVLLSRMN